MVLIIRVDERHEGPGVDEYQECFLVGFSKSRRNRSPVRSERFTGPPRTDPMIPRKAS